MSDFEHRDPTEFEERLVKEAMMAGARSLAATIQREIESAATVRGDWLAGRLSGASVEVEGYAHRLVNGVRLHFWRYEQCARCEHTREWHTAFDTTYPTSGPCGGRECGCEGFVEALVGDPAH